MGPPGGENQKNRVSFLVPDTTEDHDEVVEYDNEGDSDTKPAQHEGFSTPESENRGVYFTLTCSQPFLGMVLNDTEVMAMDDESWSKENGIELGDEIYKLNDMLFEDIPESERPTLLRTSLRPMWLRVLRPTFKNKYFNVFA